MTNPTEALQEAIAVMHRVLVAAALRRQDELPGLGETLQDEVLVTTGGTRRAAYGWFAEDFWRHDDHTVHELFLNADHRDFHPSISPVEQLLVTLLHEACHVWASANNIPDTSRGGRYHNRRFAEIALTIGLAVDKDPRIGHRTSRLTPWARSEYADLLIELAPCVELAREPASARRARRGAQRQSDTEVPTEQGPGSTGYVFAACRCQTGGGRPITIRVASGSWHPEVIYCSVCEAPFVES
jgi:hypothetical protein